MKIFGILAYPVHHSLSPQMHNAALREDKIDALYTRFGVAPRMLKNFLDENIRNQQKISGLSVSVPHKESCQAFLDTLDEAAQKIGAVNTIYTKTDETGKRILCGTNTDYIGFSKSLEEQYNASQKTVLVLGAGGATKAILFALEKLNPKKIFICNRTRSKAEHITQQFSQVEIINSPIEYSESIDLVINTTSLGMEGEYETQSPLPKSFWSHHHTAFDIVYTPLETVFLKECREQGGVGISGEKMLLFQGIAQFEIFTGQKPSLSAQKSMITAIQKAEQQEGILNKWTPSVLSATEKNNILHTIVKQKEKEIYTAMEFWEQKIAKADFAFSRSLYRKKEENTKALIAEIKPASPSKGRIFGEKDSVKNIATMYEKNGVSCISVLTDETFFGASLHNLSIARKTTSLPLLRKDFIIHPAQIFEARYAGADAILLMKSILSVEQIEEFILVAQKLGMDALVEVHDITELETILQHTSARIIGINSRDLKTLAIDPQNFQNILDFGHKNFPKKMNNIVFVAESGINSSQDITHYFSSAHALLVGTGILSEKNTEKRIQKIEELTRK